VVARRDQFVVHPWADQRLVTGRALPTNDESRRGMDPDPRSRRRPRVPLSSRGESGPGPCGRPLILSWQSAVACRRDVVHHPGGVMYRRPLCP
jgi:hypothetical protein